MWDISWNPKTGFTKPQWNNQSNLYSHSFAQYESYLCGILGQWDILLLNLTSIGFTNFFRCLIFNLSFFTNADVVGIKDEIYKENLWNWCRFYWLPLVSRIFNFTVLLMKISQRPKISFLVTTCNKKRHLEKFVKPKQYAWV